MINEFGFAMPDSLWRYSFGMWTQHPRLEGETDDQIFARIKAETERKFSYTDLHPAAPSWDAVNLPSRETP